MWTVAAVEDVDAALATLPADLLAAVAELKASLEVSRLTVGKPYRADNPDGGMRVISVGPGGRLIVVFGVLSRDRQVTLLQVTVLPGLDGR